MVRAVMVVGFVVGAVIVMMVPMGVDTVAMGVPMLQMVGVTLVLGMTKMINLMERRSAQRRQGDGHRQQDHDVD